MSARKRPGLVPHLEEARQKAKAEIDAMSPRQLKAAIQRFANANFVMDRKPKKN